MPLLHREPWGMKQLMEKKMETAMVYWGYNIGIMEKNVEIAIV